ncbi:MAG: hypothetical protein COS57_07705 [Syntrophobacterales bacterium CG03_land_8_20_14_0_80_58_14]|nr:MAG: hypothetical protein AUK26_14180 [Syntrophaceae bacterium CG2_30_58_14]PIV05068.1 MAG: hypothetical protein COS57_07705 [Syntrophobacterales bacterium CG03_land_8_20_14_0_80_58_14]
MMMISYFFRRYIVALVIGIGFIFSPAIALFAAAAPAAAPPPDTETRSLILGVDAGTAPVANADRKQTLAGLLNRGRQTALEKARNRLLELGKFGIDFDLVRTPAGFVRLLQQQETLPGKGERPHIWIEAETGFVPRERKTGKRPDAALLDRADLLDVRIWTDRKEYEEGETVTLYMQGNRDFYGKVIQIDRKGAVLQLLPNNYRQLSSFEKEKLYRIPDEGDRYQLAVQPPLGTIRFIVHATRLPMSQVNLQSTTGGIFKYRASAKAFGRSVRHVIPAGEEQGTEFCEATWVIKTVPRK